PCGWCCCCFCVFGCTEERENAEPMDQRRRNTVRDRVENRAPTDRCGQRHDKSTARGRWTDVLRFEQMLGTDDMHECAICLDEYQSSDELRRLPCGHYFHRSCVDEWNSAHCALCRQPIGGATRDLRTPADTCV